MTGTVIGAGDTEMNKMNKISSLRRLAFYCKTGPINKSACMYMIQCQISAPK